MPFEYLVVASGTIMKQADLNTLGASNWELVQIEQPDDSLIFYHVFTKSG